MTHISAIYRRDHRKKELEDFIEKKPKTLGQLTISKKKKLENNSAQNSALMGVNSHG